jgi:hypothetical protein
VASEPAVEKCNETLRRTRMPAEQFQTVGAGVSETALTIGSLDSAPGLEGFIIGGRGLWLRIRRSPGCQLKSQGR